MSYKTTFVSSLQGEHFVFVSAHELYQTPIVIHGCLQPKAPPCPQSKFSSWKISMYEMSTSIWCKKAKEKYESKAHAEAPASNCLDSWPSNGVCQTCGNINRIKIYCRVSPHCLLNTSSIRQICFLTLSDDRRRSEEAARKELEALDRILIKGKCPFIVWSKYRNFKKGEKKNCRLYNISY